MRLVGGIAATTVAAVSFAVALLFGWAFYERYWRWRDCFNELGRCYDAASGLVMTDSAFVWGLLAGVALLFAAICLWLRPRRHLQSE